MRVRFSRRATAQLSEILAFVAEEDPRTADRIARRIEVLVSLLARQPKIGRPTELENVRVFRAAPNPYLVFYRINPADEHLTILRVRHTARREYWRTGR
jgi:plasmid stabilization system protein ParE